MKNEQLIKRAQELVVDRKIPENEWELIEKFVMPFGPGKFFSNQVSEGAAEWRNRELYDLTAVFAAQTLAASIHGSVTSPSTRLFEIVTGDKDLDKVHEVVKF